MSGGPEIDVSGCLAVLLVLAAICVLGIVGTTWELLSDLF